MNEGLTGLEQVEGEYLITEFIFWVNYPFKSLFAGDHNRSVQIITLDP